MKYITGLILAILFISWSGEEPTNMNYERIRGNWQFYNLEFPAKDTIYNEVCFKDSVLCMYDIPLGRTYSKYFIKEDSIFFVSRDNYLPDSVFWKARIEFPGENRMTWFNKYAIYHLEKIDSSEFTLLDIVQSQATISEYWDDHRILHKAVSNEYDNYYQMCFTKREIYYDLNHGRLDYGAAIYYLDQNIQEIKEGDGDRRKIKFYNDIKQTILYHH